MVSDTSLTMWNGLTQTACFSSHHFWWHFSLHLSMLYIQHSVKCFLEPLQPQQPCGVGAELGAGSSEEKATACPCVCMSMLYKPSFSHPSSAKGILKVPHQPFFAFQSSAPSGSERSGSSAAPPLQWSGIKAFQFLEGACNPGDVWHRQCSAPSSSPAQQGLGHSFLCSLIPSSQHTLTLTHSPLQSLHTPLAFPVLFWAASHFHLHTQKRTCQRPHLPNELKAVASAQNLPSPTQLPLL